MSGRKLKMTAAVMPLLVLMAMIYQASQAIRDFSGSLAMAQPMAYMIKSQQKQALTLSQWADLSNGFRRVLAAQPDEPEALMWQGELMYRRSSVVDSPTEKAEWLRFAEAHLRRSMSIRPFHTVSLEILSQIHQEKKK